jgi:hypothetical protein
MLHFVSLYCVSICNIAVRIPIRRSNRTDAIKKNEILVSDSTCRRR